MYSLAALWQKYLAAGLTPGRLICLHELLITCDWASMLPWIKPANRILLRAAHKTAHQGKGVEKGSGTGYHFRLTSRSFITEGRNLYWSQLYWLSSFYFSADKCLHHSNSKHPVCNAGFFVKKFYFSSQSPMTSSQTLRLYKAPCQATGDIMQLFSLAQKHSSWEVN